MARNVILETQNIIIDPVAGTITITDRWIRPERLMLITNVTQNTTLYNFSDPTTAWTNYTQLTGINYVTAAEAGLINGANMPGTVITLPTILSTDTQADDVLQIMVDDFVQLVGFEDPYLDGQNKLKVTTPQSLIDTDFEYSIQPSKWEAISLTQNYPSFFAKPGGGNALQVTSIVSDGSSPRSNITITTTQPHGGFVGGIVSVQETLNQRVEGTFGIIAVPSIYTLTYKAKGLVPIGDMNLQFLSAVYLGDVFDHAHIPGGSYPGLGTVSGATNTFNSFTASTDGASPASNITVTFQNLHGLFPGTPISVAGTNSWDGDYYVTEVPSVRQIKFNIGYYIGALSTPSTSRIIAKNDGYVIHRPYDAGVALTTYNPVAGMQMIRQTRRYFRYQAGKGIQFSTGAKLTPVYTVDSMALSTGTPSVPCTINITTVEDHGLQAGAVILIEGATTSQLYNPYNGYYTVSYIVDSNSFQVNTTLSSAVQPADRLTTGTNIYVHAYKWYGAATRAGLFDDQNGFWFEWDGQELYVCRRHSEKLLQGRVNVTFGSNIVTGVNTQFRRQLIVNNNIGIKGAVYKVISISDDSTVHVAPAYRGQSINGVRAAITQIERYGSDNWNWDQVDGDGPSGYDIDITKMQMLFIDYTWYGAGTVRWGMRGPGGKLIWVHRLPMNNNNAVAYQRSGNLPARYEVTTEPTQNTRLIAGPTGVAGSALGPNDTVMYVENTHDWPQQGVIWMKDDVNCELLTYSSIGDYNPTIDAYPITITRRQGVTLWFPTGYQTIKGGSTPVTFTPDATLTGVGGLAQVGVQQILMQCSPIVQHWGSSVIEDGGYQQDLLGIYTGGMTKYVGVPAGTARPLLAIRVAPSADNAIGKNFGQRELLNRMSLQLRSIGIQTNGSFRIDCVLNPAYLSYTNWTTTQLARNTVTGAISGNNGSTTLVINSTTDTAGTNGIQVGMSVSGTGISAGTIVTNVFGSSIVISSGLTANASGVYTFTPTTPYQGLPSDWMKDPIGVNSLAQVLYFDNTGSGGGVVPSGSPTGYIVGGDSIFSFFSENGGGSSNYNSSVYDITGIKDLGNSNMSGNGNVSTPGFPVGPDVLVLQATNIGTTTGNIAARLSWTEAQA